MDSIHKAQNMVKVQNSSLFMLLNWFKYKPQAEIISNWLTINKQLYVIWS